MTFFTLELLIRLITSFVASVAFAIVFKTNKRHLLSVGIAGFITYFVFHTSLYLNTSLFLAAFASTFVATLYGEISARISHAPAIIFLVAGLIPIVPGGDSYYTMKYFIEGNTALALEKLGATGLVALGIASGIVAVSVIVGIYFDTLHKIKNKRKKES